MRKFVVVTQPFFWKEEISAIRLLLQLGVTYLHVRKPKATTEELAQFLASFSAEEREKMVLHDCHDLATKYRCGGIHLNRRNPIEPSDWKGRISRSCHSLVELETYQNKYDYLFLSPIFDSISKQGYSSGFTINDLVEAKNKGVINSGVFALGGVTFDKISSLNDLGFGGYAFLGDIWNRWENPDFVSYVQALSSAVKLDTLPVVLSIAGSDPSAGAGVQADLKTISSIGAYGTTAITALTIQNTMGVERYSVVSKSDLYDQIKVVSSDLVVNALKIGMLPTVESVEAVVDAIVDFKYPIIVYDPIILSTSGYRLMSKEVLDEVCQSLFPLVTLITPNINEAGWLLNRDIVTESDMERAARELGECYQCSVLLKGGHLNSEMMVDILYSKGKIYRYSQIKIDSKNLHGTGCTLSSAIATYSALGNSLPDAVYLAKHYISQIIKKSQDLKLGRGVGPMWHFK